MTTPEARPPAETEVVARLAPSLRAHLNEDWLATIAGLVLLTLVLTGVLSADVVRW
jgi:hypothetical protein